LKELDAYINGLPEKTLTILAGTNSSGKSSVCINFAKGAIEDGKKVFYWPGEQDLDQIKNWSDLVFSKDNELEKAVSKKTGNEYSKVKPDQLKSVRNRYRDDFYAFDREEFENTSAMLCGVTDYFQMVDIAVRRYGCKLIILDNLTALATNEEVLTGADYFQTQAKVVMMCKALAKKHKVSFVVCAHTKKKVYGSSGDTADDIEGLKRILNLADTVLFIRRYKKEEQREELVGVDTSIEVQKNRGGSKQWDKFLYEFVIKNKTLKPISTYEEAYQEALDVTPEYIPKITSITPPTTQKDVEDDVNDFYFPSSNNIKNSVFG
jgi:archaellum biogenesis ATPase FlaH